MIFSSGYGAGCFHPIRPGEVLAVKQAKRDMWDDFPEEDEEEEEDMADDLISRKAVVDYVKSYIHEIITESGEDKNAHTNQVLKSVANGLDNLPTYSTEIPQEFIDILTKCVEVSIDKLKGMSAEEMLEIYKYSAKEDTAEWIDFETARKQGYKCGSCECLCSNCKEPAVDEYRFCPNCGSRMKGDATE